MMSRAFSPQSQDHVATRGLRPGLVWNAPLALQQGDRVLAEDRTQIEEIFGGKAPAK